MSPLTQTHCSCECVLDFTKFSCSLAAIGTSPSRLSFTPIHVPQSRGKSLAAALTWLRSPIWTQRRFSRIPRIRSVMLRVRLELSFVPNRLTKRRVSRQRTSSAPAGGWFHFAIFFSLLGAVLAVEIEDPAALHNHPHRELFLAACERQFNLRRVLHGCVFVPHVRVEFRFVSILFCFRRPNQAPQSFTTVGKAAFISFLHTIASMAVVFISSPLLFVHMGFNYSQALLP